MKKSMWALYDWIMMDELGLAWEQLLSIGSIYLVNEPADLPPGTEENFEHLGTIPVDSEDGTEMAPIMVYKRIK